MKSLDDVAAYARSRAWAQNNHDLFLEDARAYAGYTGRR